MKKLIAFLSAGLMMVVIASPALAWGPSAIMVNNDNWAIVTTGSNATSNSGGNTQMDVFSGGTDKITTGNARSESWAESVVNQNKNTVMSWNSKGMIGVNNRNAAFVTTGSSANANSGRNDQSDVFGCSTDVIKTGASTSVSGAGSYVNGNETVVSSWGTWMFIK